MSALENLAAALAAHLADPEDSGHNLRDAVIAADKAQPDRANVPGDDLIAAARRHLACSQEPVMTRSLSPAKEAAYAAYESACVRATAHLPVDADETAARAAIESSPECSGLWAEYCKVCAKDAD